MKIKRTISILLAVCILLLAAVAQTTEKPAADEVFRPQSPEKKDPASLGGSIVLSGPQRPAALNSTFLYPVRVNINGYNVADFQFDVLYDPAIINPTALNSGCSNSGTLSGNAGITLSCFVNPAGRLNIVGFSSGSTVTGMGTLLNIEFLVTNTAVTGNFSDINFEDVFFFQLTGQVPSGDVTTIPGRITIGGTTAADTTIAGKVISASGRTVSKARVSLLDGQGNIRYATSNVFGYYRFHDVPIGETYVLNVVSKQHTFSSRIVNVGDELLSLDLVADP